MLSCTACKDPWETDPKKGLGVLSRVRHCQSNLAGRRPRDRPLASGLLSPTSASTKTGSRWPSVPSQPGTFRPGQHRWMGLACTPQRVQLPRQHLLSQTRLTGKDLVHMPPLGQLNRLVWTPNSAAPHITKHPRAGGRAPMPRGLRSHPQPETEQAQLMRSQLHFCSTQVSHHSKKAHVHLWGTTEGMLDSTASPFSHTCNCPPLQSGLPRLRISAKGQAVSTEFVPAPTLPTPPR